MRTLQLLRFVMLLGLGAILPSCEPEVEMVPSPPGEAEALQIIADTFAERGLTGDLSVVSTTWWSGDCLSRWKVDTDHWRLVRTCVIGVSPGCWLHIIRTPTIAESPLPHELKHCFLFQRGDFSGQNIEHHAACWRDGTLDLARQRLKERGL